MRHFENGYVNHETSYTSNGGMPGRRRLNYLPKWRLCMQKNKLLPNRPEKMEERDLLEELSSVGLPSSVVFPQEEKEEEQEKEATTEHSTDSA
ncbi:hypothetical protein IV203_025765 [Nitzschia inconspicua]|uniref:Uncharacterized protein n=1 Tax=Nitzschia inconspicua TaxID=303405 RepID=A0A9K3PYS6_9STRA|nr:hypothetical protein IV203_025765 [Nitzschia inconspicua]